MKLRRQFLPGPLSFRQVGTSLASQSAPRPALALVLALLAFALFLLASGRDPAGALMEAWRGVIGSSFGLSEVGVTMIPLVLTALATAIPTRVGLVNVGGEGQLYVGALTATGVSLFFPTGQIWLMLPTNGRRRMYRRRDVGRAGRPAEAMAGRQRGHLHPPSQLCRNPAGRRVRVRAMEEPGGFGIPLYDAL